MGLIGISNTVARLILGIVSQKLNRYSIHFILQQANFTLKLNCERGRPVIQRLPCTVTDIVTQLEFTSLVRQTVLPLWVRAKVSPF